MFNKSSLQKCIQYEIIQTLLNFNIGGAGCLLFNTNSFYQLQYIATIISNKLLLCPNSRPSKRKVVLDQNWSDFSAPKELLEVQMLVVITFTSSHLSLKGQGTESACSD